MNSPRWRRQDVFEILAWMVTALVVLALVNLLTGSVPLTPPQTPTYVRNHRK